MNELVNWWYSLPPAVRSAIIDSVETGIAAALAVQVVVPATAGDLTQIAVTLGSAFLGATVSALRRKLQAAIAARQSARLRERLEPVDGGADLPR